MGVLMVDGISSSLLGMQDAVQRVSGAARNISNASTKGANVDMAADLVGSKIASVQYEANVKVLKSQLDLEKRLLDILA
jgi:flagellar basal body rod protein FlgC